MIPVSYYAKDELTSPKFAYAFARGCGGTMTDEMKLYSGSVALFGSPSRWPILRQAQAQGRDWYYGDHGYFRRHQYFRITKNAYQHDGRGNYGPTRYERYFKKPVLPWRKGGKHVLVCPNSAAYFALYGMDVNAWLSDTLTTLRKHTDRELRVRWKTTRRPIGDDLLEAHATVVFSSVAAIDSLLAGVPIFTLAPFGATVRMGLTDLSKIEHPVRPADREPFVWALAHNQWTLQEIYNGDAWRALQMRSADVARAS